MLKEQLCQMREVYISATADLKRALQRATADVQCSMLISNSNAIAERSNSMISETARKVASMAALQNARQERIDGLCSRRIAETKEVQEWMSSVLLFQIVTVAAIVIGHFWKDSSNGGGENCGWDPVCSYCRFCAPSQSSSSLWPSLHWSWTSVICSFAEGRISHFCQGWASWQGFLGYTLGWCLLLIVMAPFSLLGQPEAGLGVVGLILTWALQDDLIALIVNVHWIVVPLCSNRVAVFLHGYFMNSRYQRALQKVATSTSPDTDPEVTDERVFAVKLPRHAVMPMSDLDLRSFLAMVLVPALNYLATIYGALEMVRLSSTAGS